MIWRWSGCAFALIITIAAFTYIAMTLLEILGQI